MQESRSGMNVKSVYTNVLITLNFLLLLIIPLEANKPLVLFLKVVIPPISASLYCLFFGLYLRVRKLTVYAVLSSFMLFSVCYSLIVDQRNFIVDDLVELLKYFNIITLFLCFYIIGYTRNFNIRLVFLCLFLVLFFSAVYAINDIFGLWAIQDLFVRDKGVLSGKAVFAFGNTYFAASVYLLIVGLSIALAFTLRSYSMLMFSGISVTLVIATQSRAAFLALGLVLITAPVLYALGLMQLRRSGVNFRHHLFILTYVGFFTVAIITLYVFIQQTFPYLYSGLVNQLGTFVQGGDLQGGSLSTRMDQIQFAIDNNSTIILGGGIGKGWTGNLESLYALLYFRFGILGLVGYLLAWIISAFLAWKSFLCELQHDNLLHAAFQFGHVLFCVGLPVVSLSSVITDQLVTYMLFYSYLGLSLGLTFSRRRVLFPMRWPTLGDIKPSER